MNDQCKYCVYLLILLVALHTIISVQVGIVEGMASKTVVYVPRDYRSIQEAIEKSRPGTTIYVLEGEYYGSTYIIYKRDLRIIGIGRVVIKLNVFTGFVGVLVRDSSNITIENIVFEYTRRAIHLVRASNIVVNRCTIIDSVKGVVVEDSVNVSIANMFFSKIHDNGVEIIRSRNTLLVNNSFTMVSLNDVYIEDSSNTLIDNMVVEGHISRAYGLYIINSVNTSIYNTRLYRKSILVKGDNSFESLVIKDTMVNNKTLYYISRYSGSWSMLELETPGMIIFYRAREVILRNYSFTLESTAIELWKCRDILIEYNSFSNQYTSIYIYGSRDIVLSSNSFSENRLSIGIEDSMYIELHGNKYSLDKMYSIEIQYSQNIYVYNESFSLVDNTAVHVIGSSIISLLGNTFSYTSMGIVVEKSDHVIICSNTFYSSYIDITLSETIVSKNKFYKGGLLYRDNYSLRETIVYENTVNDKPLLYIYNVSNLVVNGSLECFGQLIAYNVSNTTIADAIVSDTIAAIELHNVYNVSLYNVSIEDCFYGLYIVYGRQTSIADSVLYGNRYGVYMNNTEYAVLTYTLFSRNSIALTTSGSREIHVYGNSFVDNSIDLMSRDNVSLTSPYKLYYISSYGVIGYSYIGNYWSRNTNPIDYDGNLICDKPFTSSGIVDYYPLLFPHRDYWFTDREPTIRITLPVNNSFVCREVSIKGYSSIELKIYVRLYRLGSPESMYYDRVYSVYRNWSITVPLPSQCEEEYLLYFKALAGSIVVREEAIVLVVDDTPPRVEITYPVNNTVLLYRATIGFVVMDKYLSNVYVVLENSSFKRVYHSRSIDFGDIDNGYYRLCVVGVDKSGKKGCSCIDVYIVSSLSTRVEIHHKPMYTYYIVYIVSLVVIYGIAILIWRRRK